MKKFFGTLILMFMSAATMATDWFPVATVANGKAITYVPITKVTKQWRICVLIPNAIDRFWWGVCPR
jgi:protein TorT